MPKINAKTSVPYEPSYKPLEQRQEQVKSTEPLVRYSDVELNEFRELIQRKLTDKPGSKGTGIFAGINHPQR